MKYMKDVSEWSVARRINSRKPNICSTVAQATSDGYRLTKTRQTCEVDL